jgi:hypothetical protein
VLRYQNQSGIRTCPRSTRIKIGARDYQSTAPDRPVACHRLRIPPHPQRSRQELLLTEPMGAGVLYPATPTSQRPGQRSNKIFAARDPTTRRRYFRRTRNSATESSSCRSSADHRFTKLKPCKSIVRMYSKRKPAFFSPITIEPIAVYRPSEPTSHGDPISANSEK